MKYEHTIVYDRDKNASEAWQRALTLKDPNLGLPGPSATGQNRNLGACWTVEASAEGVRFAISGQNFRACRDSNACVARSVIRSSSLLLSRRGTEIAAASLKP